MKNHSCNHFPIIFSIVLTTSACGQIITNGNFESPSISDGTLQATTPSSWNGGGFLMNPNAGGGFVGNLSTWPQAQSGQQYEDIGNIVATALSQTFTIASSATYLFTWYDNTALNLPSQFQSAPYSISVLDSSQLTVFSNNFNSYHATGAWESRTVTPALIPGSYTLKFTSLNVFGGADTLIDNVAITVPEPSALLLASCAAITLCLRRRSFCTNQRNA